MTPVNDIQFQWKNAKHSSYARVRFCECVPAVPVIARSHTQTGSYRAKNEAENITSNAEVILCIVRAGFSVASECFGNNLALAILHICAIVENETTQLSM